MNISGEKNLSPKKKTGSRFGRSVALLTGGTALAQIITIIAAPILTRIYGPEEFGQLAVYVAIVSIGGVLSTLQYQRAIPLPGTTRVMAHVLVLCICTVLMTGLLVSMSFLVAGPRLLDMIGVGRTGYFVWLIPCGIVSIALGEITAFYAIRLKAFGRIAGTRLAQSIAQNGAQVSAGLAGAGPIGLIIGQLAGQVLGIVSIGSLVWRTDRCSIFRVKIVGVLAAARRYRRFPQFTLWAALSNSASFQAPTILLSSFFGGGVAGLFALGQQVLLMPVTLLSKSASQVFYSEAIEAKRENRLDIEIRSLFISLSRQALPLALAVVVVAPEIFAFAFGDQWRMAGQFCQWQAPWLLFAFLTIPFMPLVAILERQALGTTFQFTLLVGRIGAILVGGYAQDPLIAVALFGLTSGVLWAIYLFWLLRIGGVSVHKVRSEFLKEFAIATAVVSPLLVAKALGLSDTMISILAITLGSLSLVSIAYRARIFSRKLSSTNPADDTQEHRDGTT